MKTIVALVVLAVVTSPAGMAGQAGPATGALPVSDAVSYGVYETLVERPKAGAKPNAPVLRLETVTPPPACRALDGVAPVWKAAAQAFAAANPGPRPLVREQVNRLSFIPVTPAEIDKAVASGWERFRAAYAGAGGYVGVSAVGFDPAQSRAIVWVTYTCGPSCGSREFRFYAKNGRQWREEATPHGVSCP